MAARGRMRSQRLVFRLAGLLAAATVAIPPVLAAAAAPVEGAAAAAAAALAADDECSAATDGAPGRCALSAAQLRALRRGATTAEEEAEERELWQQFGTFRQTFARVYSDEEASKRFRNFKATVNRTRELNAQNGHPVFGVTWNADFFADELPMKGLSTVGDPEGWDLRTVDELEAQSDELAALVPERPAAINWRTTKVITPVKNQGLCGACWAFSATQEIESMFILWLNGGKNGYSETFSVQQLASCAPKGEGCGGGNPIGAYQYLMTSGVGLAQSVFWPYEGGFVPPDKCQDDWCTPPCRMHDLSQIKKFQHILGPYATVVDAFWATPACPQGDSCEDQDLNQLAQTLVAWGPVSIAVNAKVWHAYKGGVLTRLGCGGIANADLDHAVQLVGYNTSAPSPYWIVRNTWSTSWGEGGYIYLEYGQNTCGLANLATFPILPGMPGSRSTSELGGEMTAPDSFQHYYKQATGAL